MTDKTVEQQREEFIDQHAARSITLAENMARLLLELPHPIREKALHLHVQNIRNMMQTLERIREARARQEAERKPS